MKFKTEDIGLYIALGLTGAGIGLLIGAIVVAKFGKKEEDEIVLTEDDIVETFEKIGERYQSPYKDEPLEQFTEDEKEIIEEIQPTNMQFELLQKGVITIEQLRKMHEEHQKRLEKAILEEKSEHPSGYNALYSPRNLQKLPDLSEKSVKNQDENDGLVTDNDGKVTDLDDDEVYFVGNEYVISRNLSFFGAIRQKSVKNKMIFDRSEKAWMTVSARGHIVSVSNLDKYFDEESEEIIINLLEEGSSPVYIQNLETEKIIEIVEEKEEEDDA